VANEYAAPKKIVANGGSASGVIAAAAIVPAPGAVRAAVIDIPALDMLRYDRYTGAASWIPEFGSTASPVSSGRSARCRRTNNLDSRVCYPPTLVLAGEKDDIAVPSHAYKFVAALQGVATLLEPRAAAGSVGRGPHLRQLERLVCGELGEADGVRECRARPPIPMIVGRALAANWRTRALRAAGRREGTGSGSRSAWMPPTSDRPRNR